MQLPDLMHARRAFECRFGTANADPHIDQIRFDLMRPRIVFYAAVAADGSPGGALPARAHQLAKRTRDIAIDNGLHVMKWSVRLAIDIMPQWLVAGMRRRIPTVLGQIKPADKRHRIVDNHDFLVMRCANRMLGVHMEGKPAMGAPSKLVDRQPFAFERI